MHPTVRGLVTSLLPGYRSGHTRYVDHVKAQFRDGCRWLDAGGGHRIFHDEYDGEAALVARARYVVSCDLDQASLVRHESVACRVRGDLAALPLRDRSFDFITCGMVVEHLVEPRPVFAEFARVLDHGGRLVLHTVNLYGYHAWAAWAAKALPFRLRQRLIARATGRNVDDIFPVQYRSNTLAAMRRHLDAVGLEIVEARHLHAGLLFHAVAPLAALEIGYMRLISRPPLDALQGQILVTVRKP